MGIEPTCDQLTFLSRIRRRVYLPLYLEIPEGFEPPSPDPYSRILPLNYGTLFNSPCLHLQVAINVFILSLNRPIDSVAANQHLDTAFLSHVLGYTLEIRLYGHTEN